MDTGEHTFGDGLTPDEAARTFWEAVAGVCGRWRKEPDGYRAWVETPDRVKDAAWCEGRDAAAKYTEQWRATASSTLAGTIRALRSPYQ
jgi:hypothetical protein